MRPSGLSRLFLALTLWPLGLPGQPPVTLEGGLWYAVFTGQARTGPQLRVNANGRVTLEAGAASQLSYSAKVGVRAPNAEAARRILARYAVQVEPQGQWTVLTAPGGQAVTIINVKAPRLTAAVVSTSDGTVDASGVEGTLEVDSGAGWLAVDRIGGNCRLTTRGGEIRAGEVRGSLRAMTGAGPITVRSVRGIVTVQTVGGDILVRDGGSAVTAETGAGAVTVEKAGGAVTATTGGGRIWVGSAKGIVTTRNLAGPVNVGSAAGVHSESAVGGVSLTNISGSVRVSTMLGSILASMSHGAKTGESFLATANGDITVLLPSNLGVTIQAENEMADSPRRIVSDFPQFRVRNQGTRVVAEGSMNGGGPVLRLSAGAGTIFIKRLP
jgi:hypothetical protein